MGYLPVLKNQKTTLKTKLKREKSLASEYDNMFYYKTNIKPIASDVILFHKKFTSLQEARKISDHLPIWFEFTLN